MSEFSQRRNWGPTPKYERVLAYEPPNERFVIIAGPCSIESEKHAWDMASLMRIHGVTHFRGGLFRAGTYPGNSFGSVPYGLIKQSFLAAQGYGLLNIVEVLDYRNLDDIERFAACFQVGARSQQNYTLLRSLGAYGKPVFLKRNTGTTVDEWLGSAEHLLAGGVKELYLIERGSSTLHNDVRWTPCIHTIPSVQSICKIPVIIDASHGTGRRDLVEPITLAGVAAGANGMLVEVHTDPEKSLSDADQAVTPETFERIMRKVKAVRAALGEA